MSQNTQTMHWQKKRATRIGVMLYSTGIVLPIHE